jgi:hypothetical protein
MPAMLLGLTMFAVLSGIAVHAVLTSPYNKGERHERNQP